jgi:thiamine-monophosphate kinase
VRRSGAIVGDAVYVTGTLGGSLAADGGGRHLSFVPRIDAALQLAKMLGTRLHAMIDLSDGLGRDAGHLAEQSGVQIEIETGDVPCTDGCAWQQAFADGEDYELCFTASGEVPETIGDLPVSRVGRVVGRSADSPAVVARVGAERVDVSHLGWEHRGGEHKA